MPSEKNDLRAIAAWALEGITDGAVVGLGTGRAATAFIHALGERVRDGLRVRGVATSQASADLACRLGIPVVGPDAVDTIDVDVDGADEVDSRCDLIKGYGGALVREKIVAASARRVVILVGEEKLVPALGSRGKLPVEVVPFGLALCRRRLSELGCPSKLRMQSEKPFVTDNGNYILDCRITLPMRPAKLESSITAIPGVIGTGLFLGMAHTVLIQRGSEIEVRHREDRTGQMD